MADAASQAFTIKIEVDNDGLFIRPGMVADARIAVESQQAGIRLSPECIINDLGNQSYVYVVEKSARKAFKRSVSLGEMMDNKVEVLSGLSVGETVVISGQSKLSDGSSIIITK